jgi:formiminotetrahydrofolate cyclodeaminase
MSDTAPRERWDEQLPLGRWFEAVASPQPLPAGGRVASLAGAFAAALVEKIGRIVLRSPRRSALHAAAEDVAARAAALRPLILAVGEADDRAYAAVIAARRSGVAGSVPLHDAEVSAAQFQLTLIEYCVEVIELAQRLEEVGPALGADLATAGFLARAAAERLAMSSRRRRWSRPRAPLRSTSRPWPRWRECRGPPNPVARSNSC